MTPLLRQQAIKFISSTILIFLTPPSFATEANWQAQGGFEHQSFEKGGDAYVHDWNDKKISFSSQGRLLTVDKKPFNLSSSNFESLDEADFSEAKLYFLHNEKSYACVEFGFGGLLRSGSFQNIKGIIVLHSETNKRTSLVYLRGIKVSCEQINLASDY